MLQTTQLELSFFSLQLLEYLIQNHPHRAHDYDFIKSRGDEAAEVFEKTLRSGSHQEIALEDAHEELYKGLHFSLHALIKDVLWDDFSELVPSFLVESVAKNLYPHLSKLHTQFDPSDTEWGLYKEMEMQAIQEDELRASLVQEIKLIIAQGYGI